MSNEIIFLETTAVVDYSLKPEAKVRIKNICEQYGKKITAQYVRMEIKRGVLQYLIYLHNLIASKNSFADVLNTVSKLSSTPQKYRLGTILKILANFSKEIKNKTPQDIISEYGDIPIDEYQRRKSKSYLRNIIKLLWRSIDKIGDEILNPMDCFPDIREPYEKEGFFVNEPRDCEKSKFECKIKQFFREHQTEFQKILNQLEQVPPGNMDEETLRRKKSLKQILRLLPYGGRKFSNKELNRKDCWNCGDAILAVVAPHSADVLNNNQRHYRLICMAINKRSVPY